MYETILYITVAYILLCKLNHDYTITSHVFINIFQTEHFAIKFAMGYEKNLDLLVIAKYPKVF